MYWAVGVLFFGMCVSVCEQKNDFISSSEKYTSCMNVRKYAFMVSLCAIHILVVAELLNGFFFSSLKAHYDTCMCIVELTTALLSSFFLSLSILFYFILFFFLDGPLQPMHRLHSRSFIEHQLQLNENTPYDFSFHALTLFSRMAHCLQLAGNKKRKFNFRFEILYAKLDVNL